MKIDEEKSQFDTSDHEVISAYFFSVWTKKKNIERNEKKEIECLRITENTINNNKLHIKKALMESEHTGA